MRSRSLWLIAFAVAASAATAQSPFYLRDGDRVVFYGDSITDQRLYTAFVETFTVTRFPKLSVRFTHSGWGGDRVSGGGGGTTDVRLERDVLAHKPTVITIMLGMNDGAYRAWNDAIFATYGTGYRQIVQKLRGSAPNARITLLKPSPYDDVTRPPGFEGGYNSVLALYGEFVSQLAAQSNIDVADLNLPVVDMLKKAHAASPDTAKKIIDDRVHPWAGGHLIMAACLLKAWHAPSLVSSVAIDCRTQTATREGAEVSGLTTTTAGAAWVQTDGALPFPVNTKDATVQLAVQSSDFMESLNRQILMVTGLQPGRYVLRIDGQDVGMFASDDLASGVNLASHVTPMSKQAVDVHTLTVAHNDVHFARWRSIQLPLAWAQSPKMQSALEAMDDWEEDLVKQQHLLAKPIPHRFALVKAP